MLSSIDRIMEMIVKVDLKGISDQIRLTSRSIETFFTNKEMTNIVRNMDTTTAALERSIQKIDRILAEGKVDSILSTVEQGVGEARQGVSEFRQGVGEIRQVVGEIRQGIGETREGIAEIRKILAAVGKEVGDLKTAEISAKSQSLIENLNRQTKTMAYDIQSTTDDIRQAVDSLRMLIESLRENPSDLLFSEPVRDRREGKEK